MSAQDTARTGNSLCEVSMQNRSMRILSSPEGYLYSNSYRKGQASKNYSFRNLKATARMPRYYMASAHTQSEQSNPREPQRQTKECKQLGVKHAAKLIDSTYSAETFQCEMIQCAHKVLQVQHMAVEVRPRPEYSITSNFDIDVNKSRPAIQG